MDVLAKKKISITPFVTLSLILINIICFILSRVAGDQDSIEYSVSNIPMLTLSGDYWRLLSSIFLHQDIWHLLINMLALFYFGITCEILYGKWKMLSIYLLSGAGASLFSAFMHLPSYNTSFSNIYAVLGGAFPPTLIITIGMGASGAIMGIMAANAIALLDAKMEKKLRYSILQSTIVCMGLTFIYGMQDNVDNAAHFGGAFFGLLVAEGYLFVQINIPRYKWLASTLLIIGLFGFALFLVNNVLKEKHGDLSSQRQTVTEFLNEKMTKQRQKKEKKARHEAALKIQNKLPAPVSKEAAQGKFINLDSIRDIKMNPDGSRYYITLDDENKIAVVDARSLQMIKKIDGPVFPETNSGCSSNTCRGIGAANIAFSGNNQTLYVTSLVPNAFSVIDLTSGTIQKNIPTGRYPRDIEISPDESTAYVMNAVDNSISVINLHTNEMMKTVTLPGGSAGHLAFGRPLAFSLSHNGELLAVFDTNASELIVFNTKSMMATQTKYLSERLFDVDSLAFSPDDDSILLTSDKGFTQFNTQSGSIQQNMKWCGQMKGSHRIATALNTAKNTLAVTDDDNNFWLLDLTTFANIGHYPSGSYSIPHLMAGRNNIVVSDNGVLQFLDQVKSMTRASAETDFLCPADITND